MIHNIQTQVELLNLNDQTRLIYYLTTKEAEGMQDLGVIHIQKKTCVLIELICWTPYSLQNGQEKNFRTFLCKHSECSATMMPELEGCCQGANQDFPIAWEATISYQLIKSRL